MEFLVEQYKNDQESVFHTWFLHSSDRLKAFRTIRKGLVKVIHEIENDTFGNDFKGSSLEMVITAISEQKQVFEGAAHAFCPQPPSMADIRPVAVTWQLNNSHPQRHWHLQKSA
ncbi:hypothetical protein [Neobacillus jeddahensis]|uniref:hypothetical protein n=1 Tax=Neobacillus jeddahensis TaxID=1461580 RepID=UPI000590FBC9|nr:hypothetical protein [Neobacillus jeddahensis]